MNKLPKKLLLLCMACSLPLLTACEITTEDIVFGLLHESEADKKEKVTKDLTKPLYSQSEAESINAKVRAMEKRYAYKMKGYRTTVNQLWKTEGFYNISAGSSKKGKKNQKELAKQKLIDFYLFMEYHKDTQLRNLQFPSQIQEGLLITEAMFARKAIDYVRKEDFGPYNKLRNDLVMHYKNLYQEELLNIMYEDSHQVDVLERIPNLITRYNAEFTQDGLRDKVKHHLGIPDSVIARGVGTNMITIYDGLGKNVSDGDIQKLAILLTLEIRLTGVNTRLEKFFYVTNSLEGVGKHLDELERDLALIHFESDNLKWVEPRMKRSIRYLKRLYKFYNGNTNLDLSDIFITLQTREDFYALGMLSTALKDVMDSEEYWDYVADLQKEIGKNVPVTTKKPIGRFKGEDATKD